MYKRQVLDWLRKQGSQGEPALAAHAQLVALNETTRATRERDLVMRQTGGALGNTAVSLYRLSIERAKPDAERESGYQQRDLPGIEGSLKQMERRYEPSMDRQLQRYWLLEYLKLPSDQHVAAIDTWLGGNDAAAVDRALDRMTKSQLKGAEARMKWFNADRAAFEKSDDPAIQYAVAVLSLIHI